MIIVALLFIHIVGFDVCPMLINIRKASFMFLGGRVGPLSIEPCGHRYLVSPRLHDEATIPDAARAEIEKTAGIPRMIVV